MRKTKIIATLGPATDNPETLRELMKAGVNIFRLNMSHARHDWVREVIKNIRTISKDLDRITGILMDTQGPAIRTGDLPTKLDLKVGDTFTFTVRGAKSEELYSVDTNYDDLMNDINVGDVVLVDNGVIEMAVRQKQEKALVCEVLTPGSMGSRRHINLPGIKVNLPCLTEKDLEDIKVGVECGVDFVALSFVREANDLAILRQVLASQGGERINIVAKIEDQSAVRNIDEIISEADAVMVARGDLGIECPYEELPIIQRRVVKSCVRNQKPVIVATHMLESMIENPLPTRAEVTDVANAVFEEADAIMLSGETTVGKYPIRCVEVLNRIALRIERSGTIAFHENIELQSERDRVAASGVHLANNTEADAIVICTRSGRLARVTAALRPYPSPIIAFTPDPVVAHHLSLLYGVRSFVVPFNESPSENVRLAEIMIMEKGILQPGARIVALAEVVSYTGRFWSAQLRTLEKD